MPIICVSLQANLLFHFKITIMYQVFEYGPTGGKHSVSKSYPTWLGCKRVRNRIAREHGFCVGYRYTVEKV